MNGNVEISFTLHFATINTARATGKTTKGKEFTLHFATINTSEVVRTSSLTSLFTLHFATINTYLETKDI